MRGDLSSLKAVRTLTALDLSMCGDAVTGDFGVLAELTELQVLRLEHSSVGGDLAALSGLVKLEMLSLGGLQWPYARSIGGDASAALAPCKRLRVLSLMGTAITGDIGGFAQFAELNGLFLQASGVTGCLASLGGLKKLQDVDVRYTAVHSTQAELEEFDEDHPKCIVHHQWGYDTERTVSIDEFEDEEEYFERFGNSSASRYSHNGRVCWKAHADGFPSIHEFSEPLSERSIYSSISAWQSRYGLA